MIMMMKVNCSMFNVLVGSGWCWLIVVDDE